MASILIVDDNPTCRVFMLRAVQAAGYSDIVLAGLPTAALETCRALRPEVVLTDFRMAEMSGLTLIRQLGAMPETRGIACALVSACADSEKRCVRSGCA